MQCWRVYSILCFAALILFTSCDKKDSADESNIREQTKAYESAYNKEDAKAFGALWTEKAEYINPVSGVVSLGRSEIEQAFTNDLKNKQDSKLEIKIDKIKLVKDYKAVETGTAYVKRNGELLSQTAFKAIYEKVNGVWLLSKVREVEILESTSQYEHLKELEWLIGDWVDEDEDSTITTINHWDNYKNFIIQQFVVTVEDRFDLEGKQLIAWDPIKRKIRSWIFDSNGAFGEGFWSKVGDSWVVETSHTLADGRRASATSIYKPIDANSYTWESVGREIGGELLPNIDPVTVVRKKS